MSETLTTEQVEEILAGCEGVTPGPWFDENPGDDVTLGWVNDSDPLNDGGSLATTWAAGRPVGEGKINAAHIARLDPQTVSSLATELLALRKRVGELERTPANEFDAMFFAVEAVMSSPQLAAEALDNMVKLTEIALSTFRERLLTPSRALPTPKEPS